MDANIFIKEHIKVVEGILIAPDIPEKKLNNAIKAFECEDSMSSIIALYDSTLFGSAKEGIVFTGEKMLIKTSSVLISIEYKEISKAEYFEVVEQVKADKTRTSKGIKIFKGEEVVELKDTDVSPAIHKPLELFLNKLIAECSEFKEVNLLQPLEEMPSVLKNAYVKILINMAFDNDGEIDEKELTEIMFLMGRISIDDEGRFELRSYIAEIGISAISTQDLLTIIKDNAEAAHYEAIMISLVKDIFSIHASTTLSTEEGSIIQVSYPDFLQKHKEIFGLSTDKIELARIAVENDFKILYENVDDDKIKQAAKDLAAKAASVGAPIGAIYLSGSVMGLSAAGMTSGLASLGMGGMLGLSSMATGIGVAVLIGVGVYHGVKYLTSNNELSKYKTRELMLHEVIKQTQKSISLMIGDINIIVKKLNDAIVRHKDDRDDIEKLSKILSKLQGAMKQMNSKSNQCVNMEAALQCPQTLDIFRIKSLANEPTKKEIYAFITSCYEEKEQNGTQQLVRKRNLSTDTLEKLGDILQGIGYFSATNNAKSAIGSLLGKK
ncbi:hypothetical protein AAIL08_000679 [Campylobacter upsaliensis]|uniref:EF-hand domain-containing protein n=3 Tax=Campylobacter upsaliensis TaxID=28080 RepID=A0A5L4I4M8_CAMUP|nr:hypothetical protein [Campylobacter upsaliensis]EAH5200550.1 hypothetical protein [Campylobacter upsaliensis]EAH5216882.1 hypothetical protein [Campylobacter upsaliensis]EAH5847564.1 hypothetical protein [Campylobacter upsaliensis]EAH5878875.1 hypothetical protein [Campylobacter upsaliensis]EAH5976592.1 hypothetical protein [Campylobacter upsaliensis]